ncbi:hypothetical protein chiPu_0023154, partial [Chiloscyllium punctatum]|nr:hypothetical protein [Chiloscyllium punctatum]
NEEYGVGTTIVYDLKNQKDQLLKTCGEKAFADHEAAENDIGEFAKLVADESLSPEQIYNADEAALYWRYVPRTNTRNG